MLYLLIPYILIFAFFCWRNVKHGLLWTLFFLPVYQIRFDVGLPTNLLEINILVLFLVWLVGILRQGKLKDSLVFLKQDKMFLVGTFVFLVAATVSVLVADNLIPALGIWKAYFVEPWLLFLVFVNVWEKKDFGLLLKVLMVQVLILSFFAGYQKLTGDFISNPFWSDAGTRRVTSFFPYPNALALYVAPILVMFLGYSVYLKKISWKKSVFFGLAFLIGFLAIYWTKSKGALVAISASFFFYGLFFKGFRKYFVPLIAGLVMGSVILVAARGVDTLNLRGQSTVEGGDSISVRQDMWRETSQMLGDNFWTGAGLASYQNKMEPYHEKDYIEIYLYPHNFVLNFWSEIGLFGLLGFLFFLVWFFWAKKEGKENIELVLIMKAGMFCLLVHGLVDVPYFKNDLAVLWWVIVGMFYVLNEKGSPDAR